MNNQQAIDLVSSFLDNYDYLDLRMDTKEALVIVLRLAIDKAEEMSA